MHALDGGEFLAYSLECVEGEFLANFALEFSEVGQVRSCNVFDFLASNLSARAFVESNQAAKQPL